LNYKHYDDKKYNKVLDLDQQASMEKDFDADDCDIRMVADPTQGSDIERIHRAQAIYSMAIADQNQSINAYEATIGLLKSLKTPDIEVIAPKPDPNAVSPDMKLMLAERQMEAEMKKQDQMLRAGELKVKATKAALDAAKAHAELGLDSDYKEAQITQMYTQALKNLVDAGVAVGSGALDEMKRLEQMFIPQGDMNVGQIPENNTGAMGTMGGEPGNQNIPPMPPMGGGATG